MKTAYVTGVAGFLGSNVARRLQQTGYRVHGCDDLSVGDKSRVPQGVKFRISRCQDLSDVEFMAVDVVVHCAAIARSAWPKESDLWDANVRGTLRVLDVAEQNGVKNIIHASSSVVHHPDSSVYAKTKTLAERVALGAGATCLRFGNIYGPGQSETGDEPNVIAQMRRAVREDGCIRVDGDGKQSRDFVHILDAVHAVTRAIKAPIRGIWVDICSGQQTTICEIAERFGCPIEFAPSRNDPRIIEQDPVPAMWLLRWAPTIPLDDGLRQVIP